jgi:hypothetical protein
MPTLNTAFKQVFGEALAPHGFVKIKGRQPYFVRLIGNEILHIITYMPRPNKSFRIIGGVATVYRQRLSLDECPRNNGNWLHGNLHFYRELHPLDEIPGDLFSKLYEFYYSEETIHSSIETALEITKEIMLPILDEVVDLEACIEYFHKFGDDMNLNYDVEDFGNKQVNNFYNEGLLHIKTVSLSNYRNFREKKIEKDLIKFAYGVKTNTYTQEFYEAWLKKFEDEKPMRIALYDKISNDHEWIAKAHTELEGRKAANIEILKSYGLNV